MRALRTLNRNGLTLEEVIIAIVVVFAVLFVLEMVGTSGPQTALLKGQMTQSLSNMKQLHLATQQMALDGRTTGDTNLGKR